MPSNDLPTDAEANVASRLSAITNHENLLPKISPHHFKNLHFNLVDSCKHWQITWLQFSKNCCFGTLNALGGAQCLIYQTGVTNWPAGEKGL